MLLISYITSKKANNESYFIGNHQSPWYIVAFGLIGDSLSGVTYISLPGTIVYSQFSYLQLVLGYVLGYILIAKVLIPVYYRLNLTSIYAFLENRYGVFSQKTGSFYFLISRLIGAALRLYLAAGVLQVFVFDKWQIPFEVSVAIIIILMLVYTFKGGIKTLVWTDVFQSGFLLFGVILSIAALLNAINFNVSDAVSAISKSEYSTIFYWDWHEKNFFLKQFLSGAFIAVVMTGLDQNMMQKNLSVRTLPDAQKNLYVFSVILVVVNILFVSMGALMYIYANNSGINLPINPNNGKIFTDKVFPMLALEHLGTYAALIFIIGLTAATFNSADSVLTTLTTSFCIDFLGFERHSEKLSENQQKTIRHYVHIAFAALLWLAIVLCKYINQTSVLDAIFTVAAYTYGPLLGLFAFGLFTKFTVNDKLVPVVCIIPPLLSYVLNKNSEVWFSGYKFSYELLLINGLLTFVGLMIIKAAKQKQEPKAPVSA
ncbi:MAG: sodium:solute symporter [Bacteroidia bacterium]